MCFTVVLIFFVINFMYYIFKSERKRKFPPPPVYPGAVPVFGHIFNVIGKNKNLWTFIESVLENVTKNKQDSVTIKLGIWTVHGIAEPEDCNIVANTCLKRVPYGFAQFWLGNGLLTAPPKDGLRLTTCIQYQGNEPLLQIPMGDDYHLTSVPIWKVHRKLLNKALNQQALDRLLIVFNKNSRKLVESFELAVGGGPFDPNPYIRTMTLDAICSAAMGYDEENDIKKSYIEALHVALDILMKRIAKLWLHSDFVYSWTKYKKIQDEIHENIVILNNTIIKNRLKVLRSNPVETDTRNFKPFMDTLLHLWKEEKLSNEEIQDEVNTMVAAGYDTTASTTLLLFAALGTYLEAQDKVYQEICDVIGDSDRDVQKHDLSRLKYMDAFIKETMRLYPIVPLIFRILDKDVDLKHCTLPKGDTCCISLYAANRHPAWGRDAEEFVPERWLEPSRVPNNAFATFSYGKRGCIGTNYAMMSMKTSVVHMLRRYKIEADITKIKFKVDILSTPISGHFISLHRR